MQVKADLCAEVLCGGYGTFSFLLIATQVYSKGIDKTITITTKESETNAARLPM